MARPDELEILYFTHRTDVYRYLLSLCRNPATAEDLLQNTFLQAVKGIAGFRGESSIKTWLFHIARNEYFRWLKKNPPAGEIDEELPSKTDIEGDCELREETKQILDYIEALGEPQRSLLKLRLAGGLTFGEIGAMLGKSEVWARVTFLREKCKLIGFLKEGS